VSRVVLDPVRESFEGEDAPARSLLICSGSAD
jgi:hypothetical protein